MTQSENRPIYRPGQVALLRYPFTNSAGARQRPALVMLDTGDDDIVTARITSQPPRGPFDVQILGWSEAGLLRPSVVRLHKPATVEKSQINRLLGRVTQSDWTRLLGAAQDLCATLPSEPPR